MKSVPVAAPAEYGVTGIKTFMVSNDGVVSQEDFGLATLNEFIKMELTCRCGR